MTLMEKNLKILQYLSLANANQSARGISVKLFTEFLKLLKIGDRVWIFPKLPFRITLFKFNSSCTDDCPRTTAEEWPRPWARSNSDRGWSPGASTWCTWRIWLRRRRPSASRGDGAETTWCSTLGPFSPAPASASPSGLETTAPP